MICCSDAACCPRWFKKSRTARAHACPNQAPTRHLLASVSLVGVRHRLCLHVFPVSVLDGWFIHSFTSTPPPPPPPPDYRPGPVAPMMRTGESLAAAPAGAAAGTATAAAAVTSFSHAKRAGQQPGISVGTTTCSPSSAFSTLPPVIPPTATNGTNSSTQGGPAASSFTSANGISPLPSSAASTSMSVTPTPAYASSDATSTPGWAMLGELPYPPGVHQYDHCETAARTFGHVAWRLKAAGELQRVKAWAIM